METLAIDLATYQRRPIEDAHVALMREVGETKEHAPGDLLVKLGEDIETFFYVEEGEGGTGHPINRQRYGGAEPGHGVGGVGPPHDGKRTV